jgi:hypothetical protein
MNYERYYYHTFIINYIKFLCESQMNDAIITISLKLIALKIRYILKKY